MPVQSNKRPAARSALMLILMGAMGLVAMGAYVRFVYHPQPAPETVSRPIVSVEATSGRPAPSTDDAPSTDSTQAHSRLLTPVVQGDSVNLVASEDGAPSDVEPAVYLANQSIKAIHADPAKALSVEIKDRVARIDFSTEIQDGMGSTQEANFIKALQISLGQLPDVDKFQILVGGQPVESLGHFETTDPIDVIRPTPKA